MAAPYYSQHAVTSEPFPGNLFFLSSLTVGLSASSFPPKTFGLEPLTFDLSA